MGLISAGSGRPSSIPSFFSSVAQWCQCTGLKEKERKKKGKQIQWGVACSEGVWQQILGRWKGPVEPLADATVLEQAQQAGQAANHESLQHRFDLFCRRAVSDTMQRLKADQVSMARACVAVVQHRAACHGLQLLLVCYHFAVLCWCSKCHALLIAYACKYLVTSLPA